MSSVPTLVLAGRLEAISLADVLQVLATSRHDGVLAVKREDPPDRGEFELVEGRVVRASVSRLPERIGALLLRRRALDPDTLTEALGRQSGAYAWQPLGAVLLEMGALDPGTLAEALAEQIGEHTAVMLTWTRGVFRFRTAPSAASALEPSRFVGVALDTRELLLDAARRYDEAAFVH